LGEADFAQQRDHGPFRSARSLSDGQCGPFAHAIRRQYRGVMHRRGQKGGGGMRAMMFGKQNLSPRHAQVRGDDAPDPKLFTQGILHRMREGTPGMGEGA
jgi:hypothetical protein